MRHETCWRGKPLSKMTKKELIEALETLGVMYETALKDYPTRIIGGRISVNS